MVAFGKTLEQARQASSLPADCFLDYEAVKRAIQAFQAGQSEKEDVWGCWERELHNVKAALEALSAITDVTVSQQTEAGFDGYQRKVTSITFNTATCADSTTRNSASANKSTSSCSRKHSSTKFQRLRFAKRN